MSDPESPSQAIRGSHNIQSGRDTILTSGPPLPKAEHLWKVIVALAETLDELPRKRELIPSDIEEKMKANGIASFAEHVRMNSESHYLVEDAYGNADVATGDKTRSNIHRYLRGEASYFQAQNPNATGDEVMDAMIGRVRQAVGAPEFLTTEELYPCCDMIVVHAFTVCVFLKAAKNDC
jgi:hypothetical protein